MRQLVWCRAHRIMKEIAFLRPRRLGSAMISAWVTVWAWRHSLPRNCCTHQVILLSFHAINIAGDTSARWLV